MNLKEAHSLLLDVAQFVEDSQEDLHNRMQIIGIQRNLIGKLSVVRCRIGATVIVADVNNVAGT